MDAPQRTWVWPDRNWFALGALWTALVAWLVVAGTIVWVGTGQGDPSETVAWTVLGIEVAALVQAVAGITWIRARGETAVAVTALVLTLALPAMGSSFLFLGFGGGFD